MNRYCRCGGRLRRSDLRHDKETGQTYDTNEKVAHFRCDRCGREYTQRKRQAKEKVDA